jgi:hypothetical protein
VDYEPKNPEHASRVAHKVVDPAGRVMLPGFFSVILPKVVLRAILINFTLNNFTLSEYYCARNQGVQTSFLLANI